MPNVTTPNFAPHPKETLPLTYTGKPTLPNNTGSTAVLQELQGPIRPAINSYVTMKPMTAWQHNNFDMYLMLETCTALLT